MFRFFDKSLNRDCQGVNRREFLRVGSLALGGLSLPGLLASKAMAASSGRLVKDKAVVLLFLQGGPSHIEFFDPKMSAPVEFRSITGEVQTKIPGITFGGTFPKLAAMADAGFVEIHSHGLGGVGDDAALLVLAPDVRGSYALTSARIAAAKLARHPIVVLAACGSGATGRAFHTAHGLADALVLAGASAVIASPEPINDAAAPHFFTGVRARIIAGTSPAKALVDERTRWTAPEQRAWIDHLVVFQ